jgi:LysM repeat protein
MSVLRAEEPPEHRERPAVLSPDSALSRAAVRWTGPDRTAPAATVPARAGRPQPSRDQTASVPLRLTRRGRVVVAVTAALLVAALSLVIATSAQATNHSVPRAAQQSLTQVTVRPGQSLWSIAENADPDADTRVVLQQIIELNGLTGNVVFAGQRLWVPRG